MLQHIAMNKNKIAIATITRARNAQEEKELSQSLETLAALNIPVFITDAGSIPSFINFLQSIPHFFLSKEPVEGVYAQAKNSLLAAYETNVDYIFYTEPDKGAFFRNSLLNMLDAIEENEQLGIMMASRSQPGFATFPSFQQMTETTINNCCAEVMGKKTDYCYGPFLLNKKLVPYIDFIKEDIGWGWRPYLFAMAHCLGYKVEAFEKDFLCPQHQRDDDAKERIYRMKQLEENIRGLVLSTQVKL
jgi:hypothetical protein